MMSHKYFIPFNPFTLLLDIVSSEYTRDLNDDSKLVIGTNNILKLMRFQPLGNGMFETRTVPHVASIDAVVYNAISKTLILSDQVLNKIFEYNMDSNRTTAIVENGLERVEGIDVDLVAQNLYWIDSVKETLETMSLKTKARFMLRREFHGGKDLVVLPMLGFLYVSQIWKIKGYILKLSLDGTKEDIFKESEKFKPAALFYDKQFESLFWVDQHKPDIQSTPYNGKERVIGYQGIGSSDIAVLNNVIYWTERRSKHVFYHSYDIPDFGYRSLQVEPNPPRRPFKLAVMDSFAWGNEDMFINHECSTQNARAKGCSHICIPTNGTSGRCFCPYRISLDTDNKTCLDGSGRINTNVHVVDDKGSDHNLLSLKSKHIITIAVIALVIIGVFLSILSYMSLRIRKRDQIISELEIREFRHGRSFEESEQLEDNHIFNVKYKEELEIGKHEFVKETSTIIGNGNFGVVYKTLMARFYSEVAVKVPKSALAEEIRSMLCEIKTLSFVGERPNILKLLGAYTKEIGKGTMFIVTELCNNGSLINHLRSVAMKRDEQDLRKRLFKFCEEIATGMEFLAQKRVVHGDLSARNVLLHENNICKICDFGLSRKVERYATYVKQTFEPLPWAWLALESLAHLEFTHKSDIWSMGVTFWEIFTLGDVPYPGETCNLAFIESLRNGARLSKPDLVSEDEFDLILKCWRPNPDERPDATFFIRYFGSSN